jgi:hypothetical protein
VAGTSDGTGTGAQFGSIRGIAVDGLGNLYVTDYTYGTIRKVVISSGAVTTLVPASAGLRQPIGITVDSSSGNIYVADFGNYVVRKITSSGNVSILAGSIGTAGWSDNTGTLAQFAAPTGLVADGRGDLYVTDGDTIRKIVISTASVTTFAGYPGASQVLDGPISGTTYVDHPYGIAVDSAGDLFFTDGSNLVREISASGTLSTLAGEQGIPGPLNGTGSAAMFSTPTGIAATAAGSIYVADTINDEIRMGVPYNTSQPPSIQYQPQGVSTAAGATVILQATASGVGLTYQWQLNGSNLSNIGNISGALTNTLTITNIATTQAGNYTLVVTDSSGSVTSNPAVVTVSGSSGAPVINVQPASQNVNAGASPTLSVTATGATGYQWQLNGVNIPNATGSTLLLSNIGTAQRGSYTVVVTGSSGSVTSNTATVTVAVNSHLYAISSRAYLGTGLDQNIVAGFYTGDASGSKNIVVCGIGPGLGVVFPSLSGQTLAAPKLTLLDASGNTLNTNSAWGGGQALANAIATVYLTPYFTQPNSTDTAIARSVPAGPGIGYTAQIDSVNNSPGIALATIYDADSYTGTPASHLTGIATRALVGADSQNQSLYGGFYIGGTASQTVLIEALGPGLAQLVSAQTLAKPVLTLYDQSGNIIATNTGWGNAIVPGNSPVAAGIQSATAALIYSTTYYALTPGSADCAMVVTLPTGSTGLAGYTFKVSSGDSTTGIAEIEIYNVP